MKYEVYFLDFCIITLSRYSRSKNWPYLLKITNGIQFQIISEIISRPNQINLLNQINKSNSEI